MEGGGRRTYQAPTPQTNTPTNQHRSPLWGILQQPTPCHTFVDHFRPKSCSALRPNLPHQSRPKSHNPLRASIPQATSGQTSLAHFGTESSSPRRAARPHTLRQDKILLPTSGQNHQTISGQIPQHMSGVNSANQFRPKLTFLLTLRMAQTFCWVIGLLGVGLSGCCWC